MARAECPDLAKIVKIANFIALVFLAAVVFARFSIPMPAYNYQEAKTPTTNQGRPPERLFSWWHI